LGPSALLLSATLAVATAADSIYPVDRPRLMFADRRARQVGDLVTVQIVETTVATQDASLETARKTEAQANGGTGGFFKVLKLIPKGNLSGNIASQGSGATARTSKLNTTITCKVTEVTPAGQLMIQSERVLRMNTDTQTIRFSGIVRPEDVGQNNVILSAQVADARIEVLGKGPIDRHVRQGVLSRIFQYLF
jgi:flagellar L-ring protein precursor FlgH